MTMQRTAIVRVGEDRCLQPRTPEGCMTVAILHMNDPEYVLGVNSCFRPGGTRSLDI
jgi:hypothetical protein